METIYSPPPLGANGEATMYSYNLDKQLTLITRPDGQTVSLGYDAGGRMQSMTIPSGTVSYGYDAITGNLSSIVSPDGITLGYSYDGSLLLSSTWTGGVAGTVSRVYGNSFRITSRSVNGADTVAFSYDADSLLTQAGSMTLTHNPSNGLLTGSTLGSVADSYAYSNFGELSAYDASRAGSNLYGATYVRDALGRITQKVETIEGVSDTYDYFYDIAGRLTGVTKNGATLSSYTYDLNGNRTSAATAAGTVGGTYDAQDRLLSYGGASFAYTANGELASKIDASGVTQYGYDVLGNLKNAILPDGRNIVYVIDGNNRRVGKKINGVLTKGWLYKDALNPIAELDGTGTVISRFVYATKSNVPDYMIKGGVTYRIISDHLGSVRLVVNVGTGVVVQKIDYDEFGNVTNDTNVGFQPFAFAGGLYDNDTKLTRFGARDYSAVTGRWLSKDAIRFDADGTNLYGYSMNDPINFRDENGLWTFSVGVQFTGWLSGFGIMGSLDLNIGYSAECGLTTSVTSTVGAGAISGLAGVSGGVIFTGTNASSVNQLTGQAVEGNAAASFPGISPTFGLSTVTTNQYSGGAFSIGAQASGPRIPISASGIVTNTASY